MNKIAFIYPGQGAQKAGMGKDFYAYSPLAAEIYDKASEILNIDMKALCFEENDLLDQTEYTQAAMVTTCLAMTAVLEEAGLNPDVTAGLSLGEYCAIASAGGMTTEDAIRLVRKRGILMQNTVPKGKGAMAAVIGAETELIEKCLAPIEDVSIANYNCPGQIVITGKKSAVEQAVVMACGYCRTVADQNRQENLEQLRQLGVQIEPVNREKYLALLADIYQYDAGNMLYRPDAELDQMVRSDAVKYSVS